MPPKITPDVQALADRFETFGLSTAKALEVASKPKQAQALTGFLETANVGQVNAKQANLLLQLSGSSLADDKRTLVTREILDERLLSADQVTEAIKYCESHQQVEQDEFEKATGIGYSITAEEIQAIARDWIGQRKEELDVSRWTGIGKTMGSLKSLSTLRWASPLDLKTAVEAVYLEVFGPKEDKAAVKSRQKEKVKAAKPEASTSTLPIVDPLSETKMFEEGWLARLHKPGENPQANPNRMSEHLEFTKGKVHTRFPPEPNGYMHIGHLKALVINFGYANYHGGHCYLRYDDTNPEAEKQVYIDAILESVKWLGFDPFMVTYASDHFARLFECAKELIRRGLAYVDHSTAEEMKIQRGGEERGPRVASKYRDRPIEESLTEFQAMQDGKYQPGQAVLRMKQNLEDPNPQMWDLVAYRVLNTSHHRTGDTWKIYPTYDFTHCLNDSFENISHSLCTVEFVLSRQSYEWLCDALDMYRPRQSEYGRLNLQGTITSKRKLKKLVDDHHVKDWDDPRLYTLVALRRRGVPPGALRAFISGLGVTTSLTTLPLVRLDSTIRQYLEVHTPRLMLVLDPLKVTLENLPEDYVTMIERPCHPKNPAMGTTSVPFTRTVYIDRSDFREEDSADYFRLAPGKSVGLLYAERPITCTSFRKDEAGKVVEVFATFEDKAFKPKAYIQWVGEHKPSGSPVIVDEARMFNPLFNTDNPANADDFLVDLNPNSLQVAKNAMVEIGIWDVATAGLKAAREETRQREEKAKKAGNDSSMQSSDLVGFECVRFQGLRTAYFCIDKESKIKSVDEGLEQVKQSEGDRLVLNTIVGLKEDTSKSK